MSVNSAYADLTLTTLSSNQVDLPVQEEQDRVSSYRPSYKIILLNNKGRQRPVYLYSNYKESSQIKQPLIFEEVNAESELLNSNLELCNIPEVNFYTKVNEFFLNCSKYPHYQLHHSFEEWNIFKNAVSLGNIKILSALLQLAPELVNIEDRYGMTPLFHACCLNVHEIGLKMASLLIENGANVNLSTHSFSNIAPHYFITSYAFRGSTPLWIATKNKNALLVQLLLKKGAKLKVNFNERSLAVKSMVTPLNTCRAYDLFGIDVNFIITQWQTNFSHESWSKIRLIEIKFKNRRFAEIIVVILEKFKRMFPMKFW